jgi:carbon storage regulator
MLVLTRKSREAVVVSSNSGFEQMLKVTVLEVHGSTVKLGFEADDGVPIHRAEVWERIRAEKVAVGPTVKVSPAKYRVPYID